MGEKRLFLAVLDSAKVQHVSLEEKVLLLVYKGSYNTSCFSFEALITIRI